MSCSVLYSPTGAFRLRLSPLPTKPISTILHLKIQPSDILRTVRPRAIPSSSHSPRGPGDSRLLLHRRGKGLQAVARQDANALREAQACLGCSSIGTVHGSTCLCNTLGEEEVGPEGDPSLHLDQADIQIDGQHGTAGVPRGGELLGQRNLDPNPAPGRRYLRRAGH